MITIGIDPHKDTHTAAAVKDATGELLGELTVAGNEEGHERLLAWAHGLVAEGDLRFALEDCRHVNGRLERFLLAASEPVVRVGTRMTARERRGARTVGKSDAIDALAVARAALREPGLPAASHNPRLRELKLLVDHREDLVAERTPTACGCAGTSTTSTRALSPSAAPSIARRPAAASPGASAATGPRESSSGSAASS